MTFEHIVQAIALVLIIEGMMPFLFPNRWRNLADKLASIPASAIRISGGITMIMGAVLLFFIK